MKTKKLISSLCMLALTICSLAFGVYAAVKANFTASGTIIFNAANTDCDITVSIYGTTSGDALNSSTHSTDYIFTSNTTGAVTGLKKDVLRATTKGSSAGGRSAFYNGGANYSTTNKSGVVDGTHALQFGSLEFDELNPALAGEGATWLDKIVMVFDIKNYSNYGVKMTTTAGAAFTGNKFNLEISKSTVYAKAAGDGDTCQVVVTISPNVTTTESISGDLLGIIIEPGEDTSLSMPFKKQVIYLDLLGDSSREAYRVLNVNDSTVELLAMFDAGIVNFDNGTTYTQNPINSPCNASNKIIDGPAFAVAPGECNNTYAGSYLDYYLNTIWYNTLNPTAKSAIVLSTGLVQYSYDVDVGAYNSNTHASEANYSTRSKKADVGNRYIYALDIEDIETYFNGTFSQADIWTLFWNTNTKPNGVQNPWLRSAVSDVFLPNEYGWAVDATNGKVYRLGIASSYLGARPAFKIDLSKIDWFESE